MAATRADDSLAYFSNYGPLTVHIAAPGVSILSTDYRADSSYDTKSGTSMATPIVAGAAALLFAAMPNATYTQVRWGGREAAGAACWLTWPASAHCRPCVSHLPEGAKCRFLAVLCCPPPRLLLLYSTAYLAHLALPVPAGMRCSVRWTRPQSWSSWWPLAGGSMWGALCRRCWAPPPRPPSPLPNVRAHNAVVESCMHHVCTNQCRQRSTDHIFNSLRCCCSSMALNYGCCLHLCGSLLQIPSPPRPTCSTVLAGAMLPTTSSTPLTSRTATPSKLPAATADPFP